MRSLVIFLTAFCVIGSAFWAYRENYETQEAQAKAERIQREIGQARARLAVLKAEWAYLNRPDRLHALAEINFERLSLVPLSPDHFGHADEVSYPAVDEPELQLDFSKSVEVSNQEAGQ